MTKNFIICTILILLLSRTFCAIVSAADISTHQAIVVLSPGHCPGAKGLESGDHTNEFDISLLLTQKIATVLSTTYQVLIPPPSHSPEDQPLDAAEFANARKAELFISLHLSNSPTSRPMLYQFHRSDQSAPDTWEFQALKNERRSGRAITSIISSLKRTFPGVRAVKTTAPVLPLEGITMPGIMIEPFSISQIPVDSTRRDAYLDDVALALGRGIQTYLSAPSD